jgi:phosphate starvation-inducible PhoH-like protein
MPYSHRFSLEPDDMKRLAVLCGQNDEHLQWIEKEYAVNIRNRGNMFYITGDKANVEQATHVIKELYAKTAHNAELAYEQIHLLLQQTKHHDIRDHGSMVDTTTIQTKYCQVLPRSPNQRHYVENIAKHDLNFAIGPAGTGKTYLAVACAVQALEKHRVARIVLVRPAVEAGERLGFLPGDLAQKVDPYLRPLYDALYEMLGFERVAKLIEKNVIELAPLAYMRGRTLNDAFIILDESQNTTKEQMKMFLTRLGFNSIAVITGDITQIDLPRGMISGLTQSLQVLNGIEGISFTEFTASDVVRHPLVQKIVRAYDAFETRLEKT